MKLCETKEYCGEEMKRFLLKVADTFPNARIVIPGYFPLISEGTPWYILFETINAWFTGGKTEPELMAACQEDWSAVTQKVREQGHGGFRRHDHHQETVDRKVAGVGAGV